MTMQQPSAAAQMLPFLMRFATPRIEHPELGGAYDAARAMWMVEGQGGMIPVVDAGSALLEITTKTEAQIESDDHPVRSRGRRRAGTPSEAAQHAAAMLEITTKTAQMVEQDDRKDLIL